MPVYNNLSSFLSIYHFVFIVLFSIYLPMLLVSKDVYTYTCTRYEHQSADAKKTANITCHTIGLGYPRLQSDTYFTVMRRRCVKNIPQATTQ